MKILVVDDDKSICEIFTVLFSSHGYEVKTSRDGLSAITEAVEFKPDIVLLDIMMPVMSGYDFLDMLKNNTSMGPVVVVCSNIGEQTEINRATQHGADGFLQKSDYIGETLVQAVEAIYAETTAKRKQASAPTPTA